MNREILFRGKRVDNGEWVEGAYFPAKDGAMICTNIAAGTPVDETAMCIALSVDPDTAGQYTGLNDKNSKWIFEGDILQFGGRRLVVWWNGEAFQWQAKTVAGYDYIPYEVSHTDWTNIDLGWIYSEIPTLGKMTTEIIGNIHDNPELLEGEDA